MPSICELKIELKSKGIKGISGLNKSGLEALLKGGKSAEKKVEKPKVFTPAQTKGATPVVAEKQIDKKIKPPKMLMLTYKPVKEKRPKTKSMIFNEKYKSRIEGFMKSPRDVLTNKRDKVQALMLGGGTDAEKKQARLQYEILNEAILRQIMKK